MPHSFAHKFNTVGKKNERRILQQIWKKYSFEFYNIVERNIATNSTTKFERNIALNYTTI